MTNLFAALVKGHQATFTFNELLESLLNLSAQKLVKQNFLSIGRCVSAIVLNASATDAQSTVQRFIKVRGRVPRFQSVRLTRVGKRT